MRAREIECAYRQREKLWKYRFRAELEAWLEYPTSRLGCSLDKVRHSLGLRETSNS